MEKTIITFSANEQCLQKTSGIYCYASNIVSYIEAHFDLGANWSGYDSVRAVWSNDNNMTVISTVLDSNGVCVVPFEVLKTKGVVKVNLVGSISVSDVLTDRLTTFPCEAVKVTAKAKIEGSETQPITPSQFEQFVTEVKADADRAETVRDEAEAARDVAVSAKDTAVNAVEGFEDIVDTATATAVQTIQGEGATQVTAIQTEGTTQVASVRTEGSTQVTAVQDKGDEVLDSIPADYTQLSQNVTDLKSDLNINDSILDCNEFAVGSGGSGNWAIDSKTHNSVVIRHKQTYTSGNPRIDFQLSAGTYLFFANFDNSTQKSLRLSKNGETAYIDLANGAMFTVDSDTDYYIWFNVVATGTYEITHISLCTFDNVNYVNKLINKSAQTFVLTSGAINVDFNTNKITIPAGYISESNNARIPTTATELNHGGYFYFLYYDLASKDFILKKFTESVDFTDLLFIASIPDSANGTFICNVPFAINGIIKNRVGTQISSIGIASKSKPIIITNNRTIIFPKGMYINNDGVNYNVTMSSDFEYDFKGNSAHTLKTIYIDTSKLPTVETDGFTNDLFLVREQGASTTLNPKYKLIAIIPDSFSENGIRPYTVFDYIIKVEADRKMRLATGFIPITQEVTALYGEGAIVDANAYDQFSTIIALWDALLTRANQYGTYVEKCWIDGVAYDNSNRVMTATPTVGEHNPRGDTNQYPLIMYKFKPANYDAVNDYTAPYKPRTKRLLIVSGIHGGSSGGDHLESPIAVYYFAKRLVEEFYLTDSLVNIRNNYEIDFIPVANPFGINNKQRVNEISIDINRDFEDFNTVTAQQLKTLIDSGIYDFVHDSHCLGGTSLTSGDLLDHSFVWIARSSRLINVGKQVTNFIGAKYSLKTTVQNITATTLVAYASSKNHDGAILTEIPANTPLYYGDTVGDVHGEEVVKRGCDFIQNTISVMCNYLENFDHSELY